MNAKLTTRNMRQRRFKIDLVGNAWREIGFYWTREDASYQALIVPGRDEHARLEDL
jgi:hypothetical protein